MAESDSGDVAGNLPPEIVDKLVPHRSEGEIIAGAVALAPHLHNTDVGARLRRAMKARIAEGHDDWQEIYEMRVREIGGDPDEMMGPGKPRYTMEEDYAVKDHDTGLVYRVPAGETAPAAVHEGAQVVVGGHGNDGRPSADGESARIADPQHASDQVHHEEGGGKDIPAETRNDAGDSASAASVECDHLFLDPITDETACSLCGMNFKAWAES